MTSHGPDPVGRILYVSWGGTGRSASLRAAFQAASEGAAQLVYLAVLDNSAFGDIADEMALVVADELEWLLDAQINLTRSQLNMPDLAVQVIVGRGDVVDQIVAAVEAVGDCSILLGAPVPVAGHAAPKDLIDAVAGRTGQKASLVLPAD